jgi:DNA-binding NarL/FixJ family response regulator
VSVTVVVADDQPLIRAGLIMLLSAQPQLEVVGEASDGREALDVAERTHPDVLLMDVRMPGMDGIEATELLTAERAETPDRLTRVLVLTTFNEDEVVYGALRAGASGFLLKHAAPQDLTTAVLAVARGDAWIDPAVAPRVIAALASSRHGSARGAVERLTPREREVLVLMAEGRDNREISEQLVLSSATVKTHVSRILMKTGSRDRAQAVALAYQTGLLVPRPHPR